VVEGLELTDAAGRVRAFSVQYHPEAAAGPHDAGYLFDRFVELMGQSPQAPPMTGDVGLQGAGGEH
jgi:carbamoyl-phosphate synthase small subunit